MRIYYRAVAALALAMLCAAAPAAGQQMNADEFYQRAMKLKKKGAMALFAAGEIKVLKREVTKAGNLVKQTRLAAEAKGKQGRYCPPTGSKRLGTEEFLDRLGAIPERARRSIDMTEATTRIMEMKFPCASAKG